MKSTRRLLSILLCLVMCLSLLPTAFAADDVLVSSGSAGAGATFKLYASGKLVINGGYGIVYDMAQWSFADNPTYDWTEDDIKATRAAIKELVIEEGIVALAVDVFHDCPNLTRVSLPESMTYITDGAFRNCSGLTAITIPSGVTYIGAEAFKGCVSLTDLLFTKSVKEIGASAFEDCTKLSSVTFPAGAMLIDQRAFANCKALKSIAFLGSYDGASTPTFGVTIADGVGTGAFVNVTADVYYPVDNETWNIVWDPMNTYNDFGGRLTWKAAAAQTSSEGWVLKADGWYYYIAGKMIQSNWKGYAGKWFYFGADGKMVTGLQQIDGNYYYFGKGEDTDGYPLGARVSGLVKKANGTDDYFFDENGIWQPSYSGVDDNGLEYMKNGWQQSKDGKWFFIRNKAKVTGWLWSNGYWYYLDPTTGAMVTGWLTWKGNTYYLRPLDKAIEDGLPSREGSMIAGRSATIGGTVYTFDNSGALVGGKMEDNPMGLTTGFQNEGSSAMPDWKFYGSDGKKATGWLLLDGTWYYFDNNGTMQTGWKYINGAWYYLTKWEFNSGNEDVSADWDEIDLSLNPKDSGAGAMVTGFNKIPYTKNGVNTVRTYFFKSSGALNGRGWIKVGLKWYFLETDGVVVTGWFRDNTKWYFLDPSTDPIGEMVTGYVEQQADGTAMKDPSGTVGGQSFAASGEWLGANKKGMATKAGAWAKHDGIWYYYDANGDDYYSGNNNALTGWISYNGKWYYLDPSSSPKGAMLTGWQDIDGETYYFDLVNGDAKGGWQKIDGVWYYMYPVHDGGYGKMLTGWQLINGKWYYLFDDPSSSDYGALQDGWIKKPANDHDSTEYWFYLEENESSKTYGAMQEGGWKKIKDKWYYFHNEHDGYYGKLEQGEWINTNGKWYFVKASTDPAESWMVTGVFKVEPPAKWPGTWDFGTDGACKTPPTTKTGWQKSGSDWVYINSDGSMATGEQNNLGGSGKDYYFNSSGIMQTGVQKVGSKLYYYDSDGAKVKKTGLQTIGGTTYFFNSDYSLKTGWHSSGSDKYYFDDTTAAMLKGLQKISGKNYYFDPSTGKMQTSWQTVNGKKYYFDTTSGEAKTGQQTIDGAGYYFDDEGVMQTGLQTIGGKKYYYDPSTGKKLISDWQTVSGNKYYFDTNGAAVTGLTTIGGYEYFFNDEGVMQTGMQDIGSDTYYFDDATGAMLKAEWKTIDGNTYRFNGEGKMIKGTTATIDSKTYTFDENGVLQGEI